MSDRRAIRGARCGERGSALVEFVLCFSLFWVPFFMGMWKFGMDLIRTNQVTEVCRDAAHMWAYAIDFSQPGNQAILQKVAQGINITSTGQGVVILSTVTFVASNDCQRAGLQPHTNSCPNMNQHVFTQRVLVGNASVGVSGFGTPNAADMDSSGNIGAPTYLTDTTCRATGFSNLMTLSSGQYAFMAEMVLNSPDLSGWGPLGNTSSRARSIF